MTRAAARSWTDHAGAVVTVEQRTQNTVTVALQRAMLSINAEAHLSAEEAISLGRHLMAVGVGIQRVKGTL